MIKQGGRKRKGVVLFAVLGTILVVVFLTNVILTIIGSHSRLTHHQISRIQAYYAAWAGINFAYEKLRLNNDPLWPLPSSSGSYTRTVPDTFTISGVARNVSVTVKGRNLCPAPLPPAGVIACIDASVNYTAP